MANFLDYFQISNLSETSIQRRVKLTAFSIKSTVATATFEISNHMNGVAFTNPPLASKVVYNLTINNSIKHNPNDGSVQGVEGEIGSFDLLTAVILGESSLNINEVMVNLINYKVEQNYFN